MLASVITRRQVASRFAMLDLACNRCPRRGRLSTYRLIAEYGADIPIPDPLRVLSVDCPQRQTVQLHDVCGVHCPKLAERFRRVAG